MCQGFFYYADSVIFHAVTKKDGEGVKIFLTRFSNPVNSEFNPNERG